jgi:hypothetical protein
MATKKSKKHGGVGGGATKDRRAAPRLTLDTFLKELHSTGRYKTYRGARRAVGRADDWTAQEREIGWREIDRRWPDAPPRIRKEFITSRGPVPVAAHAATPAPGAPGDLGRHLGQALATSDLAYLMWVIEQLHKLVDTLTPLAAQDPELKPSLQQAARHYATAVEAAFGKVPDMPPTRGGDGA